MVFLSNNGSRGLTRVPFSSPVACYHGDAGVDLNYVASVGVGSVVATQLGSAAASVPHQKEAKDGGNVQAQRGGEEANGSDRARKTPSASTAAQGRTPHMIPRVTITGGTVGPMPSRFLSCHISVLHRESSVKQGLCSHFSILSHRPISLDMSFQSLQLKENMNNLSSFYVASSI